MNCPSNIVVTSCFNVQEFYSPTASNMCCGVLYTNVVCTPPSGSIFAVGTTTTVTCSAIDCFQNTNFCTFTVTVLQGTNCATNCLQIQCPSNMVVPCANLPVFYAPTVTDSCCSNWTLVCTPPSGSFFAPNTTNLVDCFVTDYCGLSNSCSFTVTVLSGTNCPTNCISLQCPSNILVATCSNCVPVYYSVTASNTCCFSNVAVNCSIPSGSCFPLGTNTVQVTAYDPDCASTPPTNCSFTVTVVPGTGCATNPCIAVECPSNIVVTTCSNCAPVYYSANATVNGICCTNVSAIVYNPPPGTCFNVGVSNVDVTVYACGFITNCQFTVTVNSGGGLQVVCPTNKTVPCGSEWMFDLPTAISCCTNQFETSTGLLTNILITSLGITTNGVCPQPQAITQIWSITDGCGDSTNCSQTVTVECCQTTTNSGCCGPGLGTQTIQWLQYPATNQPPLLPDPLGANTSNTWIITNLPCYGNVLVTQTFPDDFPDLLYWFLNPNLENAPGPYGSFQYYETGYGPYLWGTFGSLLDFYNGHSSPISYTLTYYFLNGPPSSCNFYLGVIGLAESTTATVSQPVTFRAEYDLAANAPGGNGYASANTTLNGVYGPPLTNGVSGTVVGSAYLLNYVGDPANTGWAVLQPTNSLQTTNLPSGSGTDINNNPYPAAGVYPYVTLAVTQEPGDGIAFSVGYVCCTNCLQVQCPTNKTVPCGSEWTFDLPIATSCCSNEYDGGPANPPTNVLIISTGIVTNGACPQQVTITQSWLVTDLCGDSTNCSQTVTVECCQTNCIDLTCPSNIVVTTCSNCAPVYYSATATVNGVCCTNVQAITYTPPSGTCFPIGTTTVHVTAYACGFITNCDFDVTVNPGAVLQVVCPTNKTVECCTTWSFDPPTATTCCDDGVVHVVSLGAGTNGACPQYASNTWSVYDDCGNSNICHQVVTIIDTTPPVISCPTNTVVVALNSNCDLVIPAIQVTASDCCTPFCDLKYTQSPTNGTIIYGTSAYVTVTVTDLCSNSTSCTVLVQGVPRTGLIVDWPGSLTVTNCLVPCVSVTARDCACPLQIPRVTQSPPCGAPVGPGITSVTVTVTDCLGASVTKVIPLVVSGQESFLGALTNTGISLTGALLPQDAIDPHYFLGPVPTPPPAGYTSPQAVVITNLWPWLEVTPHVSEWIAPATDDPTNDYLWNCPPGYYTYTNVFTLPVGANPATASISGRWAADDGAVAMYLNGFATGNTIPLARGWGMWSYFTINSNFISGRNTILFVVTNAAQYGLSPTGLRVEFTNASLCTTCAPPVVNWTTGWQTLQTGSTAMFNINPGGTPPFTYQWQLDGTNIADATNASLQVSDITVADAGQYNVIVTGPCGIVIHQIPLNVTPQLPWANAIWNVPSLTNPLAASFGPDLVSRVTDSGTNFAISAGTTEDFGLPNPGGQIVNVMDINPQAGALIQVPPVVESGEISDSSYTLIIDLYEPDTSSGMPSLLYASDYVSNLTSGGQDGLTLSMDASNYLHITTYSAGAPADNVSITPIPLDVWNRIALVVEAPLADGTGGGISGYLNGVTNVTAFNCPCCIAQATNFLNWSASTPSVLSGMANGFSSSAELYISSIQFHAIAMTPQMIAGIGSPDSGPAPVSQTLAGPSPTLSAAMTNGVISISWSGSPYVLQETTDLSSGDWMDSALPFTEIQTNGNILTTAVVSPSSTAPCKFYRLVFRP